MEAQAKKILEAGEFAEFGLRWRHNGDTRVGIGMPAANLTAKKRIRWMERNKDQRANLRKAPVKVAVALGAEKMEGKAAF
jgi:hypothetical protein